MKKNLKIIISIALIFSLVLILLSCKNGYTQASKGEIFSLGFASEELSYEDMSSYYIAGYNNGKHPSGILDAQKIKAVWIDNGKNQVLLIVVDCIALDGGTVKEIRENLKNFSQRSGCDSINIISTHTHAGVDTLGLWGPIGINGKNNNFNKQIISLSLSAAEKAYANKSEGKLFYSATPTVGLQNDSRDPINFDNKLYQLRFEPNEKDKNGIRIVSFAAHAESLRGKNTLISADFPGELAKIVLKESGDELVFLPGALGGLIMTPEFDSDDLVNNMRLTAKKLSKYVLTPKEERELSPSVAFVRKEFETKLENTLFIYYKFLGILENDVKRNILGDYIPKSELTLLSLGDVTLALIPGEIFPELVYSEENTLCAIAKLYGIETLVPICLANDELGYIIPENDFVLDEKAPFVNAAKGHYEETNSLGKECADDIKKAFIRALEDLNKLKIIK